MSKLRPVAVAVAAAFAIAIIGGAMTDIGPWYEGLEKSALTPPNWVFGPAWTVIYALAAFSSVFAWRATKTNRRRAWLVSLFFINAVLNVLWSFFFFTLRRPDLALAEVATLWLSVFALIAFLWRFERRASLALLPYLIWVAFATYLNYRVVILNPPFDGAL